MVSRTTIGKSFDGLVRYQYVGRRDQPTDKQAEILASSGVSEESAAEMISDFNLGKAVNPKLGYPVWHTSLSFNPDDAARLDSAQMRAIAEGYLQKMGLDNTQYVIVRHHDQPDNQHLHIIANRVDNDGKTIDDGRNFYRSKLALQTLIKEHGLTPTQGQRPELQHPERLRGTDLARYELRTILTEALRTETQRARLLATLKAVGVTSKERVDKQGKVTGISFEKDGCSFKGSELGPHLSLAGIDKQLAANELKKQVASAASGVIVIHQKLTRATPAATSHTIAFASAKAKAGGILKEPMVQPQVESSTPESLKSSAAESRQADAAGQEATAEQVRLNEQAVVAVAAFQQEKELIASKEREAREADRKDDVTQMVKLNFEEIPVAKKRMLAYEAEAKSTPFGRELLTALKDSQPEKVLIYERRVIKEKLASRPVAGQAPPLPQVVEPVALTLSIESLPASPAVLKSLPTALSTQQPAGALLVNEEIPIATAPLEAAPPVAPRQAAATPAGELVLHPVASAEASKLPPALIQVPRSVPDPGTGLPPAVPVERKAQLPAPVGQAIPQQAVVADAPKEVTTTGIAEANKPTVSRSSLSAARPVVPGATVPPVEPVAQPRKSPEGIQRQLPAMLLAERLISDLPDLPATAILPAPVAVPTSTVVPKPVIVAVPAVVTEAAWQQGIIRMQASERGTSEERLSAVRAALLQAGATIGEEVPPASGRDVVALLPYAFDPTLNSVVEISKVLNAVQASGSSKVQEQPHRWYQSSNSLELDHLKWPEREGQFNRAHVLIDDPAAGQARATTIADELRRAGASVSEIKRDVQGFVTIQVSYHTHAPDIKAINSVLDRAAAKQSLGIEVKETQQQKDARYDGATWVAAQKEKSDGKAIGE
jgi:hypothetical protein